MTFIYGLVVAGFINSIELKKLNTDAKSSYDKHFTKVSINHNNLLNFT